MYTRKFRPSHIDTSNKSISLSAQQIQSPDDCLKLIETELKKSVEMINNDKESKFTASYSYESGPMRHNILFSNKSEDQQKLSEKLTSINFYILELSVGEIPGAPDKSIDLKNVTLIQQDENNLLGTSKIMPADIEKNPKLNFLYKNYLIPLIEKFKALNKAYSVITINEDDSFSDDMDSTPLCIPHRWV